MARFKYKPPAWAEPELEPDEAAAAYEAYATHRAAQDFSTAGDLLEFFGWDFFHDSSIALSVADEEATVEFKLAAFVNAGDEADRHEVVVPFVVALLEVVRFDIEFIHGKWGLEQFGYSEIDGLEGEIEAAQDKNGGLYHSLTIQCPGGWVSAVFRSARVTPVDSVQWMSVMRDPTAKLNIFGLSDRSCATRSTH